MIVDIDIEYDRYYITGTVDPWFDCYGDEINSTFNLIVAIDDRAFKCNDYSRHPKIDILLQEQLMDKYLAKIEEDKIETV